MKQPDLGLKIIELRKLKALTQEELVEKCDLNVRTLQRIESGEVNPRAYTIKRIFATLDYDISQLTVENDSVIAVNWDKMITKINNSTMKKLKPFMYNFFFAIGIVWFLCALIILIFRLNFGEKEILLTLILPLAYSLIRLLEKNKTTETITNYKKSETQ